MQKNTLQWKKTIGVLAIVFSALRFLGCMTSFLILLMLEKLTTVIANYADLSFLPDTTHTKILLLCQLAVLTGIFILGIMVLCVNKGVPDNMPRLKARKITADILILLVLSLIIEIIPHLFGFSNFSIATIFSILYFVPLLVFCILGLESRAKDSAAAPISSSPTLPVSPIDAEIEELKKQIELSKLKKELAQIEEAKQTELEQLAKELAELE